MGEALPGSCTQKQKRYSREANRRHERRKSTLTVVRYDVQVVVVIVVVVVVVVGGEDNKVDPAVGKELIDKKSQMTRVKLERVQSGLDTHIRHRSHDDQMWPEDDPGRDVRKTLLEVQVQVGEAEKTRRNEDV